MCDNALISMRINEHMSKLYHTNDNGDPVPFVCVICDRFLKRNEVRILEISLLEKNATLLTVQSDANDALTDHEVHIPKVLSDEYTVKPSKLTINNGWLRSLLLSPYGTVMTKETGRTQKEGYACCSCCKHALKQNYMPPFAIANGYWFGATPDCLLSLSRLELALLSPIKSCGYIFMYTGGAQLKGSLSYFKVAHESIARSLTKMEVLGLNNDIVVILYGYMTPAQKAKAMKANRVNMNNLLTALQWLLQNNLKWKEREIDIDRIKSELQKPIIIDTSKTIHGDTANNNVELTESFEIFFPDGNMTSLTGGQKTMEEYRTMIQAQKRAGFDIALRCDLSREIVKDEIDDNLVNACLLQFPYGYGGMNNKRFKGQGTRSNYVHVEDYVRHLSRLALPQFHEDLFCLILYNMYMKQRMVSTAGWRVRHGLTAQVLSKELSQEQIEEAIAARTSQNPKPMCNAHPGHRYMSAIDTVAQSIPHTNAAAKQALSKGEAMQFHFGQPSYFLTVTPDDNNSVLVQIFNWKKINQWDVSTMTNAELKHSASKREILRITYPGICAFVFELLLEVVFHTVIGWNMKEGCQTEETGLFGQVSAVSCSIEEQGRGTLHAHILIWSDTFKQLRESMYTGSRTDQRTVEDAIIEIVDNLTSTTLIGTKSDSDLRKLPHMCTDPSVFTGFRPQLCQDNILRFLRHKHGFETHKNQFISCRRCHCEWSNTDLLCLFLRHIKGIHNLESYPDESGRLKAMIMEYQRGTRPIDKAIVRAAYDTHIHTKACFKINKKQEGRNRKRTFAQLDQFECRFRYPRRTKRITTITNLSHRKAHWYSWDGSFHERDLKEINVKRAATDAFQNESCTAIVNSTMACNTNMTVLLPGPVAFYVFKYNLKGTQEEDQQQYERIASATKKILSKADDMKSANSIAISRLLAGSYAHHKDNVIKGTLASYITRNHSRFLFSHDFVWCPLHDIFKILNGESGMTSLIQHGNNFYFSCCALHYLCRPRELEDVCAYDFYSKYQVVKRTAKTGNEVLEFTNEQFNHPSYSSKTGKCLQVVKEQKKPSLVRFSQYLFPDTAQFNGNIFNSETPISDFTEAYCKYVLLLFHPFRTLQDLIFNSTFTDKLRYLDETNQISEKTQSILQNIQDVRANAARITNNEDDLARVTTPYERTIGDSNIGDIIAEDLEMAIHENETLENLLQMLNEDDCIGEDTSLSMSLPQTFSIDNIRDRGRFNCGHTHISSMLSTISTQENPTEFIRHSTDFSQIGIESERTNDTNPTERRSVRQDEIVKILLERTSRRPRFVSNSFDNQAPISTLPANGSAASIFDWAETATLDPSQRRAFEIFAASFVLTFFEEASITNRTRYPCFAIEKRKLEMIIKKTSRPGSQLICLLHGPAGCGKTTVIDLLIEYAREYCTYLPDVGYSTNTVVVTAMSGVAATLIMGETTHSALQLNRRSEICNPELIEKWLHTRLVIIDEISFASVNDITKIYNNLSRLKQNRQKPFGGVHIIFSGDFRQLEPIGQGQSTIFSCNNSELERCINCYIELNGRHRFASDPEWGHILQRFRDGHVTLQDIDKINTRLVKPGMTIPDNISYATYQNKDRDAINAALFATRCQRQCDHRNQVNDSVLIFCDNIQIRNAQNVYVPFKHYNYFWTNCCGSDIVSSNVFDSGKGEPVLQLYPSCQVMLANNINVARGQANGTRAIVKQINIKPHIQPTMVRVDKAHNVPAVLASQVESIELEHCNERVHPPTFLLQSIEYRRPIKILKPRALRNKKEEREKVNMKFTQFPILLNNATTGHKLQGTSLDLLFVHEWKYSVKNWIYVVLSRVRTLRGLYFPKPLSRVLSRYSMPTNLAQFIERMRTKHAPEIWTPLQYSQVQNHTYNSRR